MYDICHTKSILLSDISGQIMERITIRLPRQQADMLEKLVEVGEFPTVSEAVRYAVRELIQKHASQVLKEREQVSLNV